MVLPASHRIPRVLRYSGTGSRSVDFTYGAVTLSGCIFQSSSAIDSPALCRPSTPESMLSGLASFPFARRYLGNHCYFLFLRVLRCFSSPGSLDGLAAVSGSLPTGFPIRISAGQWVFAPNRGFSQLITSFVASESHRHPPCALLVFPCSFRLADLHIDT